MQICILFCQLKIFLGLLKVKILSGIKICWYVLTGEIDCGTIYYGQIGYGMISLEGIGLDPKNLFCVLFYLDKYSVFCAMYFDLRNFYKIELCKSSIGSASMALSLSHHREENIFFWLLKVPSGQIWSA